jgi:glycosyltransferase involved in cell wall biosynthesis
VRILYLTDRLGSRGGADYHLLQLIAAAVDAGHRVTVACGRRDPELRLRPEIEVARIRGLATPVESRARLDDLDRLLEQTEVVHVQNVMNPHVLRVSAATGRAVVTVQDHRVFCPSMGKTLPDRRRCSTPMGEAVCSACLPETEYLMRTLELTRQRRDALHGARLIVLSRYMAAELEEVGLPGAEVIPPWIAPGAEAPERGTAFLLAGRLVSHKGVLDAWRAWRASGTEVQLRVAGTGRLEPELGGAELLGWLDASALRVELRRARALLFPTYWQEPFGILGLQSLAEATPVIVAESGGSSEWSGAGCIRVPAGDVTAMAEAIDSLDRNPDEAMRLGQEGREAVTAGFARAILEPRLLAVYEELRRTGS